MSAARLMNFISYRSAEISAAFLLCAACILGGASQGNAAPLAIAELVALPALGIGVWKTAHGWNTRAFAFPVACVGAIALVPLLQLIPLTPSLWTALPGRAGMEQVLHAAGIALPPLPVSLTPGATIHCALALIPPAAMFLITLHLNGAARMRLTFTLLAVAVVSVLLGLLQLAAGSDSPLFFYADTSVGSANGFFANRDHQADFLACAIPLAIGVLATFRANSRATPFATAPIFLLLSLLIMGVAVTASRAGVILAVIALAGGLAIFQRSAVAGLGRRLGLGLALAMGLIILVALTSGRIPALARFSESGPDLRFTAAPLVLSAVKSYWPVGSGMGSFIPLYQAVQPPTMVDPSFFNHAHDDFLEVSLEAGVAAWVIFAAFIVWYLGRAWAVWREAKARGAPYLALAATLIPPMILLHSTVDYPLRTVAMTTLFAFACGLMTGGGVSQPLDPGRGVNNAGQKRSIRSR